MAGYPYVKYLWKGASARVQQSQVLRNLFSGTNFVSARVKYSVSKYRTYVNDRKFVFTRLRSKIWAKQQVKNMGKTEWKW